MAGGKDSAQLLNVVSDPGLSRAMLEAAPDAQVLVTQEGAIVFVNAQLERLFGYTRTDLLGEKLEILIPERLRCTHVAHRCRYVDNPHTRPMGAGLALSGRKKDGTEFPIEVSLSPVKASEGASYVSAAIRDATERRELNQALTRAKENAESALQVKSQFLATMSHEIRTPMNAIIGMTSILMDRRTLDEQERECVATIRSSGDHLLGIINDILDFSKIEAGYLELDSTTVVLQELVQGAVDLVAASKGNKPIDLSYSVARGTPDALVGDRGRLRQVLVNLLSNAVKFTKSGEVAVVVSSSAMEGDQRHMFHFSVRDTGVGIAPDRIPRLFQSFSQADSSTTREYGGTGLGLAISKRLVEAMGGTIEVQSTPAQGSTFSFTILAPPASGAAALAQPSSPAAPVIATLPPPAADGDQRRLRVLVVEDNVVNQKVVLRLLDRLSYRADVASNGREAVEALERQPYDVMLMDIQMPVMDGLDATRAICKRWPRKSRPRIIAMTAHAFAEDQRRCHEAGMDDYLAKPIRSEILARAMAQCTRVEEPRDGKRATLA